VVVSHDEELVVNIALPSAVGRELQATPPDGVTLEEAGGGEQSHRFGLAETVVLVGLVKGVMEVVKLALDIRDRLRAARPAQAAQPARLSLPGSPTWIELSGAMSDTEVQDAVRRQFA
jgi:hypothetical protein